jgi:hypothetical protein
MQRIWLKHYPPGISAEIDPSRYASLVAMLEESFAKHRERIAFICMDKGLTYGETDECRALSALGCRAEAWRRTRASPSDAEHTAVSGGDLRRPACRLHSGEH